LRVATQPYRKSPRWPSSGQPPPDSWRSLRPADLLHHAWGHDLYEAFKGEQIKTLKVGRRRLIVVSSLLQWLAA
jgi:hypothetical protein